VSLELVLHQLTSVYTAWPEWLVNPRFARRNNEVSWNGRCHHRFGEVVSARDISYCSGSGQYSFQAIDGSIFQMVYDFDACGKRLISATLGFYQMNDGDSSDTSSDDPAITQPNDELDDAAGEIERENGVVPWDFSELAEAQAQGDEFDTSVCRWMRIDYAPHDRTAVVHESCHLHLSGHYRMRVPLRNVPSPRQFVDAAAAWFAPEMYMRIRLPNGNWVPRYHPTWVNARCVKQCTPSAGLIPGLHLRV
jgi:hypothetical protein